MVDINNELPTVNVSSSSCLKIIHTYDSLKVFIASSTLTISLPSLLMLFTTTISVSPALHSSIIWWKAVREESFFSRCNVCMNIAQFPVIMHGYKFCQSRNFCFKAIKLIHSVRTHTSIDENIFHRLICISQNHSHFTINHK